MEKLNKFYSAWHNAIRRGKCSWTCCGFHEQEMARPVQEAFRRGEIEKAVEILNTYYPEGFVRNKFPGRCPACQGFVGREEGYLFRENGQWIVRHTNCLDS